MFIVPVLACVSPGTLTSGAIQLAAIPQGEEAAGEYVLESAKGQPLPAVVSETGFDSQEVIAGSMRLDRNGTYVWRTVYRHTERGVASISESVGGGRYSQQGTQIVFLLALGDTSFEGTLDGDTLKIQADVPMVYRKDLSP